MTIKIHSKNIKDRLKDDVLDLSLCDLQEVPVKEIASIKKATHLDLSNNLLVSLPVNFVTINRLVKLDLSKNMLTELPDNFGELRKLKHLDLYANQISRLPLSLSELKNLRWLDLKDNPLTPAVASVAGPCSNLSECQACARNVVAYLSSVKLTIQEEKQRRLNTTTVGAEKETVPTKKEKKKKKKTTDKENKNINANGPDIERKPLQNDKSDTIIKQDTFNNKYKNKSHSGRGAGFFRGVMKAVLSSLFLISVLGLILAILPLYDKQRVEAICTYIEKNTGISLKSYQTHSLYVVNIVAQTATELKHHTYNMLSNFYDKYVRDNVERAKNSL